MKFERLYELREENGLKQITLAEYYNTSIDYIVGRTDDKQLYGQNKQK